MKKLLTIALLALGLGAAQETLRVGATPVPHAEILEVARPLLAEDGIDLRVVEFTDYVQPNLALAAGDLDANFFQHVPYLESFAADRGLDLVTLGGVHVEPIGLYSASLASVEELPDGAQVAIPNDPTNAGRALLLLERAGLVGLAEGAGLEATPLDVVENPRNLRFRELEAAQLPRALPDVAAAVINTNYALEAGLDPTDDALLVEGAESPYVNVLVARAEDEDAPALAALVEALRSDEVRAFIETEYEGAIVPAF